MGKCLPPPFSLALFSPFLSSLEANLPGALAFLNGDVQLFFLANLVFCPKELDTPPIPSQKLQKGENK